MSISSRRLSRKKPTAPVTPPTGVHVVASAGQAATTAGATGIALASPAVSAAGDLAVMTIGAAGEFTHVVPDGWTALPMHLEQTFYGGPATAMLFRRLDGSENWPLTITTDVAAGTGWAANLTVVRGCSGPPVLLSSGATAASPSVTTGRDLGALAGGYTITIAATTGSAGLDATQPLLTHGFHAAGTTLQLAVAGRSKPDRTITPSQITYTANPTKGHRATYWFAPVLPDSGPIIAKSGQVISGLRITRDTVGPAITIPAGVTNVTIEDCEIGPCCLGTEDMMNCGIIAESGSGGSSGITIRRNVIHGVSTGVWATRGMHPLLIEDNVFFDIRGPFYRGQAVQIDGVSGGSGQTIIQHNTSDWLMRTMTTHYEDHINMYMTSAVSSSQPILVRWNRIRGGDSGSGTACAIGDTGGDYQQFTQNVCVWNANISAGIAGGNYNQITNNLMDQAPPIGRFPTQTAWMMQSLSGYTPNNATITNNRVRTRGWAGTGNGSATNSGWWDGTGAGNTVQSDTIQDMSLVGEDIWETVTDLSVL